MSFKQLFKQKLTRHLFSLSVLLSVTFSLSYAGKLLLDYEEQQAPHYSEQSTSGWGSETLQTVGGSLQNLSPIPLANACGLGASSCFRCHNDRRAPAPAKGPEAPWHVEHDKVNYSCAGCHQGNPRILKKDIAHANLIANSVSEPAKTCASCHGAEADAKAKVYLDKHPHLQGNQ